VSVLCVVPVYLRTPSDLDVLARCLVSLWATARDAADVLIVDDGSPELALVEQLAAIAAELGQELHVKPENEGFSRTVNVGLQRALEQGRDAVLVNADIEFVEPHWLEHLLARTDADGRPAAVVGARLLYPNGCLQHAGVFFSLRARSWWHRYQYGPADLPEALEPTVCPVTAALQLIRHETLVAVGLYDEEFRMAYEDVDYCLRVFAAGLHCVYEPAAVAVHGEQVFRGRANPRIERWQAEGAARLVDKWRHADFSAFVPEVL
jgi:GT2 family glycosyltransferase